MKIRALTGAMGAEIQDIQIGGNLSNADFDAIHQAFLDYGAIFFRDQKVSHEDQIAFARRFGNLEEHPIVESMEDHPLLTKVIKPKGQSAEFGVGWHTDNSFFENPSMATCLYGDVIPPYGGDTVYANQYLAYASLSEGMKKMLEGLQAVHSAQGAYTAPQTKDKYDGKGAMKYKWSDAIFEEVKHPVVRTHPETGKKALYVNPMFTTRFEDMTEKESAPLLNYLFGHATRPEYCCRFVWAPYSLALWDNRAVQHYAVDDYKDYERVMYRVTVKGDHPS